MDRCSCFLPALVFARFQKTNPNRTVARGPSGTGGAQNFQRIRSAAPFNANIQPARLLYIDALLMHIAQQPPPLPEDMPALPDSKNFGRKTQNRRAE